MDTQTTIAQRWVEVLSCDCAFELMALERIPEFGFTGVNLWTSFEWERQADIDNYYYTLPVEYSRYPQLNALRDREMIRRGADFLHEYCRRAHRLGVIVQHVYHLCNFVGRRFEVTAQLRSPDVATGLQDVQPEWFNAHEEIDYSRPDFYEFMVAEVEDFFNTFPQIDGLFCWNCECSAFTPSRLTHQTVTHQQIADDAIHAVYDVCQRHGKVMTHDIHARGADAELTRGVIDAAAVCPDLILGGDATYSDWQIHLPTTPWLAEMANHNRIYVGFDVGGEFFGQGRTIAAWPHWITKHFEACLPHHPYAISVRSAVLSPESSTFMMPLLELNARLISQLAVHGEADFDGLVHQWWGNHFSGECPDGMSEVIQSFEAYIEKALYINGTNITDYNPDHSFPVKAVDIGPGIPVWHGEQFTRPGTPLSESMCRMIPPWGHQSRPVDVLRQEKCDAMAICDEALSRIGTMTMGEEDRAYFVTRLSQARDFAEAFLHTINVTHALYQIVGEHHDQSLSDPATALGAALQRFGAHADKMEERWGTTFYRQFVVKMRRFADDIPRDVYALHDCRQA